MVEIKITTEPLTSYQLKNIIPTPLGSRVAKMKIGDKEWGCGYFVPNPKISPTFTTVEPFEKSIINACLKRLSVEAPDLDYKIIGEKDYWTVLKELGYKIT